MSCPSKPQKTLGGRNETGDAKAHHESKILWQFVKIMFSGSGAVVDIKVERKNERTDSLIITYLCYINQGYNDIINIIQLIQSNSYWTTKQKIITK